MLFSEPKIPQLQSPRLVKQRLGAFQCSSASRKFLNTTRARPHALPRAVSVLFSEPKIPQSRRNLPVQQPGGRFQCSSASRKFLNRGR